MKAHELAKYLLERCPDLPVLINGWGSNEGSDFEVSGAMLECGAISLGYDDAEGNWDMASPKL